MIKMSFHFLCVIYMTTLPLFLIKGQNFETTKPRLFFSPLKEYIQGSIMLIFCLDQKEKDPVVNSSGTLKEREKRREREGEGLRRHRAASSNTKENIT